MPVRFAAPLYEMHDSIGEVARKYGIPFAEKESLLLQLLGTEWDLVINTSLTTKDQTFNIALNKYLDLGEK